MQHMINSENTESVEGYENKLLKSEIGCKWGVGKYLPKLGSLE